MIELPMSEMERIRWIYTWRSLGGLYDLGFAPLQPIRRSAVRALGLERGMRVLDLACGTGLNLPGLARAVGPTGEVVGVDFTPAMLAQARARCEQLGLDWVRLQEGDAADPHFPDAHFDAIICSHALSIIPRSREALRRALSALKPGGTFVVMDLQRLEAPLPALESLYELVVNPLYESVAYQVACAQPGREILKELRRSLEDVRVHEFAAGAVYVASGTKPGTPLTSVAEPA